MSRTSKFDYAYSPLSYLILGRLDLLWCFIFGFVLMCRMGIELYDLGLGIAWSRLKLWFRCWGCDWGLVQLTSPCESVLDALSKRSSLSSDSFPPQLYPSPLSKIGLSLLASQVLLVTSFFFSFFVLFFVLFLPAK